MYKFYLYEKSNRVRRVSDRETDMDVSESTSENRLILPHTYLNIPKVAGIFPEMDHIILCRLSEMQETSTPKVWLHRTDGCLSPARRSDERLMKVKRRQKFARCAQ